MQNWNPSYDEKGFPLDRDGSPTPLFLQGTLGSLAEERRFQPNFAKSRERMYNKERGKAFRELEATCQPDLFNFLTNPNEMLAKLASLRSSYPNLTLDVNVNVGTIIKQKVSLIRSFLIWYLSLKEVPKWIDWMICQEFDRILLPEKLIQGSIPSLRRKGEEDQREEGSGETEQYSPKIRLSYNSQKFREALALYSLYQIIGREETWSLITEIYSEQTLKQWKQTGESLARSHCVVTIPRYTVREKVRRRGYAHSSTDPNSLRSQKGRIIKMINQEQEVQELEDTISRIKLKQAQLFEKRLDALLALQAEVPKEIKKEVFNHLIGETIPVEGEDTTKYVINPNTERRKLE